MLYKDDGRKVEHLRMIHGTELTIRFVVHHAQAPPVKSPLIGAVSSLQQEWEMVMKE